MRFFCTLCILFFSSIQAYGACYERYYDQKHLDFYKNQELRGVVLSWTSEYALGESKSFRLQVYLKRDGRKFVGEVTGLCSDHPVSYQYDYLNPDKPIMTKHTKTVTCNIKNNNGSFKIKKYSERDALLVFEKSPTFANIAYKAKGRGFQLPSGDLKVGIDANRTLYNGNCEDALFKAHKVSVPRVLNEAILHSIRNDLARPTVTARNLYQMSSLLWSVYNKSGETQEQRDEAMSYAAYRFLKHRYALAPGNVLDLLPDPEIRDNKHDNLINSFLERLMLKLGYTLDLDLAKEKSPSAALGLLMADEMITRGLKDKSREAQNYAALPNTLKNPNKNLFLDYLQSGINNPLEYDKDYNLVGGGLIAEKVNINWWIPLFVPGAVDQGGSGNEGDSRQAPLTLFWGHLATFGDLSDYKSPTKPGVYFDPVDDVPTFEENRKEFIKQNLQVIEFSGLLNPENIEAEGLDFDGDGVPDKNPGAGMIDVSPASWGNHKLGTNNGDGYRVNEVTGAPYKTQKVKAADFYRGLAEFWADGPKSETPPGHWNVIANYTIDELAKKKAGFLWKGKDKLSRDEYELRTYLALNGALHDAAVVAWGIKGHFEGNRPISVLRKLAYMAENDEAFAKELVGYSPNLKMVEYTAYQKKRGEIQKDKGVKMRKLAVYAWRGHSFIGQEIDGGLYDQRDKSFRWRNKLAEEEDDYYNNYERGSATGVGWILADNWMPYQKSTFVTPPFPGFISGHSTFSRAAAEILTYTTGSEYFPNGLGVYKAPKLEFEHGKQDEFEFQWAKFYDAADQSGISRIYGGIHASYDDLPARKIGAKIGKQAAKKADEIFKSK